MIHPVRTTLASQDDVASNGGKVPLSLGGTNATTAEAARSALGLAISVDVQAYDAALTDIAGLADPNADRILFWDDSAGAYTYLTPGTGLTITGTTIDASGGGGGGTPGGSDTQIQYNDGGSFGGDAGLTYNKTTNALAITSGSLSVPGSGIDSEQFGAGATATAQNAVALGTGATASGVNSMALGKGASAPGDDRFAIGALAAAGGVSGMALGTVSSAAGLYATAIGFSAVASNTFSFAFGNQANSTHVNSIAIGVQATTTAPNQFMIGSSSQTINQITLGSPSPIADLAAVNNSLFIGSDHSNKLCWKDGSGTVNILY